MSKQHVYTPSVVTPSGTISGTSQVITGDQLVEIDVLSLGIGNNQLFALVIDVSQLKSLIILCGVDMTLEFNSSSSGTPTLNMLAGKPYIWNTSMQDACLLNTDVTALYITNAAAGSFKFSAIVDPTV